MREDEGCASSADMPPIEPREPSMRGFWSRQTLHERMSVGDMVTDPVGRNLYDWRRLDPAGYRLTMGAEVYVSPAKAEARSSVRSLDDREAFLIPPGQFAFLLTEEVIRVPSDAYAFIALRSKRTKFRGLVNVSGFHADPGYQGRLVFAVFNAGPGDVHLRRGDELFMIAFADLDRPTDRPRPPGETFLNIPVDLVAPIAGEIQSLAGLKANMDEVEEDLDDRLNAMERDVAILRWAVALILGAFVTLLVRALLGR
ncbi:MAG: dCTP deaminase domain-containing protein [Sphingomonas pseudosanguinis]|uniref:dCTP deaminase domain-containing protein n=1 Tax=Sphingomonas pseudosanguinis TaxID=413712 RepID=UPI001966D29D|nr:hypothetical protein [Roseomonas aeriglobus]